MTLTHWFETLLLEHLAGDKLYDITIVHNQNRKYNLATVCSKSISKENIITGVTTESNYSTILTRACPVWVE